MQPWLLNSERARPWSVRAVVRNCSLRFENSLIRLRAYFSDTTARRGRSILSSLMAFSLFMILHILPACKRSVNRHFSCYTITCALPHGRATATLHHAHAYASVRGSVPAFSTPVFRSITIAASDPSDNAPVTRSLWPRASNCLRTASGTRDSTERSPGYIVCGKGEAGN